MRNTRNKLVDLSDKVEGDIQDRQKKKTSRFGNMTFTKTFTYNHASNKRKLQRDRI